tara:strand:- start:104805 stop:105998 length:1194 start_codon:yes stop_codon:yes gene_type:complete
MRLSWYLFILLFSLSINSHQRSESYSNNIIKNYDSFYTISTNFTVQHSVLYKFDEFKNISDIRDLQPYVLERFRSYDNCLITSDPLTANNKSAGYVNIQWDLKCEGLIPFIKNNTFFEQDSSHTHIATFKINGKSYPEKIFSFDSREWYESGDKDKNIRNSSSSSVVDYIWLGIEHIISGLDHIAFLASILLLRLGIRKTIFAITGFTIGHSITLILGSLKLIEPSSAFVESAIGFSIMLVSIEAISRASNQYLFSLNTLILFWLFTFLIYLVFSKNYHLIGLLGLSVFSLSYVALLLKNSMNFTILITSFFGLIHGFGFAGNLKEIGINEDRILQALLGFNIGVEIGQLIILFFMTILWFLLKSLFRRNLYSLSIVFSSFLVALGGFWFLERLFIS